MLKMPLLEKSNSLRVSRVLRLIIILKLERWDLNMVSDKDKAMEVLARQHIHEMKDLGEEWRDDYIIRNCPEMTRLIERGKNKGEWEINWDGDVTLEELIGNGNPRKFLDTESGSYFIKYLFWQNGSFRVGRAVDFTRHKNGIITVMVKTPEDFNLYGTKDEEVNGVKAKRKYKKRKVGDSQHINFNNILYALHPYKYKRQQGGRENRLLLIAGKRKATRNKPTSHKSKGKKRMAQKGLKTISKRSQKPRGRKKRQKK